MNFPNIESREEAKMLAMPPTLITCRKRGYAIMRNRDLLSPR
jgi:hypothetical protein